MDDHGDDDDGGNSGGPTLDEARLDPEGRLRAVLGRAPGEHELTLWAAMPGERREGALGRIPILRRWVEQPGEMTAAEAAAEAGLAVSRWYEVAAAWKAKPTLSSVGSFAKKPGRRGQRLDGDAINVIQSILPVIVGDYKDAKVGTLVSALQADERLRGMRLPHVNTLRTMVEREKRRLKGESQVGGRPGLDVTAVNLMREDGDHHLMFAVVDRTSRLILGFSVGRLSDSRAAYAEAARDALVRLEGEDAPVLPWSDRTERIDAIIGDDADAWHSVAAEYAGANLRPEFSIVSSERRYGRYLKLVAGTTIGNLRLHPARTGGPGKGAGVPPHSDAEARTAIEVEVARHNTQVMAESVANGAPRPASDTLGVLRFLADL